MYAGFDMRGGDVPTALMGFDQPFLSASQAVTLKTVTNAIARDATICLLTGAAGVGKTAMLDRLAAMLSDGPRQVIRLAHPLPQPLVLQGLIARSLGLHDAEHLTPAEMAQALQAHPSAKGERRVLLLVDDAHMMAQKTLSYLDLVYELLSWRRIVLQVVLTGRNELLDTLRAPAFVSLLRRVGVHAVVDRLSPQEIRAYLDSRLAWVGLSSQTSMTQPALDDVLTYADANPRRIDAFVGQVLRQRIPERSGRITRKLLRAQSLIPREAIATGGEGLVEWRPAQIGLIVLALAGIGLAWWNRDPLMTQARIGIASLTQPGAAPLPVAAGEGATAAQTLVDAEIARLVTAAQAQTADGHVATPPRDNALETLRVINNLVPRASAAGRDLAMTLPSRLTDLARAAETAGQPEAAGRFRLVARLAMALQPGASPIIPSPDAGQPVSETTAILPASVPAPDSAAPNDFALPVNAPTHLVLGYARDNPDARANAGFIATTLRNDGLSVEESAAPRRRPFSPRINYFFAEDRAGAVDIGHRLTMLLGRSRPVLLAKRDPMPNPGTVEVILP